jgi:glyoxylase-like metal-dependent hydrolase (beta-lactamase superfamily II)
MHTADHTLPTSKHFRLQALAKGVYAAIALPGSGSLANAGIIDLGESTLLFDTFWTPQAAQDLRMLAEQLTGHSVAYVVNSHADGDHIHGNQMCAGATIIATEQARVAMAGRCAAFINWLRANTDAYLRTREQYITREQDARRRRALELSLASQQAFAEALPTFELTLPTLTFDKRMTLHGSRRSVELVSLGGGHSESDAFLLLPDAKIAFMGDLLFVQSHPTTWKGDPHAWIDILEQISAYDLSVLVPGHGPVGNMQDVVQLQQLLQEMLRLVAEVVERKEPAAATETIALPPAYAAWEEPELFARNLRFMHEVLAKRELVLAPQAPKVKRDAQGRPISGV